MQAFQRASMHRIFIVLQLTRPALERNEACCTTYRIWIGEIYEAHQPVYVDESHLNRISNITSFRRDQGILSALNHGAYHIGIFQSERYIQSPPVCQNFTGRSIVLQWAVISVIRSTLKKGVSIVPNGEEIELCYFPATPRHSLMSYSWIFFLRASSCGLYLFHK